jgi:hypothetical protein
MLGAPGAPRHGLRDVGLAVAVAGLEADDAAVLRARAAQHARQARVSMPAMATVPSSRCR